MFFGILTAIVFIAWITLIALQTTLDIKIELIQGVEKAFYLMIGAFSSSLIEQTKNKHKNRVKK